MDYEKKYKEAFKWIESIYPKFSHEQQMEAEAFFPELKESEDERIRKDLIEYFKWNVKQILNDFSNKECIAWLEKQGEQKPADKVETKFKVWDSIKTTNEETLTITKIDDKGYWSEDLFICGFDDDAKWELVEQKPAWSEEDDRIYYSILADIRTRQDGSTSTLEAYYNEKINWLKSLKEKINEKQ